MKRHIKFLYPYLGLIGMAGLLVILWTSAHDFGRPAGFDRVYEWSQKPVFRKGILQ